VISQPSFFQALGVTVSEAPVDDWKLYFKYKLVDAYAPFLTAALGEHHFDFHSRTLSGVQERRPRWKRAISALNATIGEGLGRLYVERHFKPEAKRRIDGLVSNLTEAFELSIDELDWMGPKTKTEAHDKLRKLTVKIGYPDKWKDYSKLTIAPDDLVGNLMRSALFGYQRSVDKLGKPIDRTEWFMTPQTINAYYNASMNEIVFPAAILQPPFFDATADDAVNYGAIGAVIGHEISHAFDDQGRKYDGDGNLRDWWTPEDQQRFTKLASGLVSQYSAFKPIDDLHVNGELTLGENIGDLSGAAVAFKAYRLSLRGKQAPVIAGFTGEQRFFLGYSQSWRGKYRDEKLRVTLVTDSHSPPEYRVNGVVANMNEFYEAFDVSRDDGLYLPPERRVKIW
jgi:predicted metalloendopeptidase